MKPVFCVWLVVCTLAGGCNGSRPGPPFVYPTVPVDGRLQLAGGPLPTGLRGWITFFPLDGAIGDPVTARLQPDGGFYFERAPIGLLQVRLGFAPSAWDRLPRAAAERLLRGQVQGPGTPLRLRTRKGVANRFDFDLLLSSIPAT